MKFNAQKKHRRCFFLEKFARHCSGASLGAVLLDLTAVLLDLTHPNFNTEKFQSLFWDKSVQRPNRTGKHQHKWLDFATQRRPFNPKPLDQCMVYSLNENIPYIDSMVKEKGFFSPFSLASKPREMPTIFPSQMALIKSHSTLKLGKWHLWRFFP